MNSPLIECVPNFSEARRPEVVDAIQDSIASVPLVRVLDRHSDLDHNRSVITFVGPPEAVEEAAYRGIAKAAELIDLDQHTGAHPRIGATDVVPFVPISGATLADCVEIAHRLGERVGEELGIPVYLYEAAATRPDRQNLENLRRGQYEGLKHEIATNPDRQPDFGPLRLGPAGATVIGARPFLIAYNVYLTTPDVEIAKKIARAIRHSSGGLRYVKALGLEVDGRAQVSMNLTEYRQTPLARAVELIRREAARYGVAVHHSELVGLIPQEAMVDAAVWYLQLDQFEKGQVLETRLAELSGDAAGRQELVDRGFLDSLASATPTPGGGSAAAYAGAMAAALVAMVARLTIGKKKYAAVQERMREIETSGEALRADLTAAVSEDAAAFDAVMAAVRLPKETPEDEERRSEAIEAATVHAAEVPLGVAGRALEVLRLVAEAAGGGNLNAISDAGSAAALAGACLSGAALNVRINAAALKNRSVAGGLIERIEAIEGETGSLQEEIRNRILGRGGQSPR
jgi:glutamate formiminotransferase/formiminotetrahydrofolate cyclodeaminase